MSMPAIERVIPLVGHLPVSIREALARRLRELAGLGLIALSGVATTALMTWSVQDPSLSHATSRPIRNVLGYPGAIGADLLSGWIEDGTAARIADWKRHEGAARQGIAKRLLNGQRFQTHPSSPHIWLSLPTRWSSEGFVAQARTRGVVLNASSEFAVGTEEPKAVRLCVGTPRTRASLEQALARVSECLQDRAPTARAVV